MAVDSSVVIAALSTWHERHDVAREALEAALDSGAVIPIPALHESYSVLTRLPPPLSLTAAQAAQMLRSLTGARLVTLDADWADLDGWAAAGVTGGLVYDARILACARRGGVTRLLTFNRRHFEQLDLSGMEVVVPGGALPG